VKLYLFQGSCAALTTRLELDYKRLPYELVYLPPVLHGFILGIRGFPRPSVPALEADGRRISGTLAISRALDELQPDPPLFPADPARRATVEEAERWGEDLQDAARRILYCAARRKPSAWGAMMAGGQPRPIANGLRAAAPGTELNAADFEIATNIRFLLTLDDLGPAIETRPAAAHARRIVPGFPARFPTVLPGDWLKSLHG
jgi:glutathione S-transferase